MNNIIGIDPSKVSSAIYVKSNKGEFIFSYTNRDRNYKWIKKTNDYVYYRFFEIEKGKDYADQELKNLISFSYVSTIMIRDVLSSIDKDENTYLRMEGYNYNTYKPGDIIDLVAIGQSIRIKMVENLPNVKEFNIIAPKKLKTSSCEYAYGPPQQMKSEKTGKLLKKWIPSKNKEGIKGGDFTKKEMFKAMIEGEVESPIYNFYKENFDELINLKNIIKPFEDINDAIWLGKIETNLV